MSDVLQCYTNYTVVFAVLGAQWESQFLSGNAATGTSCHGNVRLATNKTAKTTN